MAAWRGGGLSAAIAHDAKALLLARTEQKDLADLARSGDDDEASRIICSVAAQLHAEPAPSILLIPPNGSSHSAKWLFGNAVSSRRLHCFRRPFATTVSRPQRLCGPDTASLPIRHRAELPVL